MPNNPRNIFLDFDGTLIDSRERLYNLFQELAPQSTLTFDEYWEIKRARVDQQKLLSDCLAYTADQIGSFKVQWKAKVEEEARLLLDKPLTGVDEFLFRLKKARHRLHLVTARQKPELVEAQLNRFGWRDVFAHVLVTRQSESKENLVRRAVSYAPDDIFVGDTGEDIQAARNLGIRSIAVSSGVLSASILREYNPNFICENICEIHTSGFLRSIDFG